jgi:ATP-dependent DNA helicase RecQ
MDQPFFSMERAAAERQLKLIFGFDSFYDDQWMTVQRLLKRERILLVEKTGFGKSLCYQFPAVVFEGLTVIFSPLIALMRDQVTKLNALGIAARCINSEQSTDINTDILQQAIDGKLKILYIAPERQENSEWVEKVRQMKLSMVVVDEAHCISVWGHDFRPAFRRIISLVRVLPRNLPVLATTATATERVQKDILDQMGSDLTVIRGNLLRDNFNLYVIRVNNDEEKMAWLAKHHSELRGTGFLYTGTRSEADTYSRWLEFLGISSVGYHAGLDPDSRVEIERGLMNNKWKIVVSTNALGMGIDKPDIRFVIHTQIPQSPVHYYQEIGRAGRDGKPATIILFYGTEDRSLPESFIESAKPAISKYERVIECIMNELLSEKEIVKKVDIKVTQFRVIKADLIEQQIIREIKSGKSIKYEYVFGAPPLDTKGFEALKGAKYKDLESIIGYVGLQTSRMKYLCDFLGDSTDKPFTNCDNTGLRKLTIELTPEWQQKIGEFRESYFPELVVDPKDHRKNGVAASYYGVSTVGKVIHRSKYEKGGDFPEFLLQLTLKAFRKRFGRQKFDLLVYVPPTSSGSLVKNFATKLSAALEIPISQGLVKTRQTTEQKAFQSSYGKRDNVSAAFDYVNPAEIQGKHILLFDDIYDSGATLKEIGKLFSNLGAAQVSPIVIAKTVGGDQV